jgi:cellulose synthase/poly-beta-1,6-N-acetylglucosamine synthase-like glycosyltransferase
MEFLTGVYLFYIITTMYISIVGLMIYYRIKTEFLDDPGPEFNKGLSVIVPAYNEEKTIGATLQAILDNGYPKDKLEIIVVNDGSTDGTVDIVKKYKNVILLDKPNSGKADSVNKAIKKSKHDFIAVIDADSYPQKNALKEIMKYFADEKVGGVTGAALVKNRNNLLEKCQAMEYVLIAWTRKSLDAVHSVFVTPGSLSAYRKTALEEIGGFDTKVMTEDIEIAWNLLRHKWKTRMAIRAKVFTSAPSKVKAWYNQRIRWNVGGFQTLVKHWSLFGKKEYNMFGVFVIPFFISHLIISFTGFFVFLWVIFSKLYNWFLFSIYSVQQDSAILDLSEIYLLPSVFTYFALLVVLLFGLAIYYSLKTFKEARIKIDFSFFFYALIYLSVFPILLIISLYLWKRGYAKW